MWDYYVDREKVTLEVLQYSIKDNQTFDAELTGVGYNDGQVTISYDRELSSLEEDEVSGYVRDHVSYGIKVRGQYKVDTHRPDGSILKVSHYLNKEGDFYNTLIKETVYYYEDDQAIYFIEEGYDLNGNVYLRKKYSIFSDPITGQLMVEEE